MPSISFWIRSSSHITMCFSPVSNILSSKSVSTHVFILKMLHESIHETFFSFRMGFQLFFSLGHDTLNMLLYLVFIQGPLTSNTHLSSISLHPSFYFGLLFRCPSPFICSRSYLLRRVPQEFLNHSI